jgi:hypothetical protein
LRKWKNDGNGNGKGNGNSNGNRNGYGDSNHNKTSTNNSALTTAMMAKRLGCASQWWQRWQCWWWGE